MKRVAVLFARHDSHYKALPECDVYDRGRNALLYGGSLPVIAHPPCRAWSRMRAFARPRRGERALAVFAVEQVRRCGGVLEHPAGSSLWKHCGLPAPGESDRWGFALAVRQFWWGHRAEKATWLYICRVPRQSLPSIPFVMGDAPRVFSTSKRGAGRRPEISKAEREHTPPRFATWLVETARAAA